MLHGLRERAGVTQREIAADLEIDQTFISRIERGKQPAPDRVVRYYGERFGAADLLSSLVDIARENDRQRRKLSPLLIARQARYPLARDAASFVSETPADGTIVPCGMTFTKTWTIRNSGAVAWRKRRVRRVGPTTGPWTLTSSRFSPVPDTEPGGEADISVEIHTPQMETAAVAQWKMVDEDELLYFPTQYSVGLAVYVLVGHSASLS
ncbi:MAG: helix-turn-helix domain-containing protein [Solirubrobacterales bacterium]|nr:helix-turn-helix domain-containing protein [Solirubrobacterales bacterium]